VNAEERFAELVATLADVPGVTVPDGPAGSRFGSSACKVDGSIFAMLTGGALVVKLPADRVAQCVADGTGAPFGAGKGKPMREWLTVVPDDPQVWSALAREALHFVGGPRRA
jgi:hypothetical protein